MDATCPTTPAKNTAWNTACSSTYTISDRLSDFSEWRGSLGNDGAGLWHLMTQCKYVYGKTLSNIVCPTYLLNRCFSM
jgi:hypothetical protein